MKKIIAFIIAVILAFSAAGCSNREAEKNDVQQEKPTYVDNRTNNMIANTVSCATAIDNKLYYETRTDNDDGVVIYEIADNESRPVYSEKDEDDGTDIITDVRDEYGLSLNYILDGSLYRYADSDSYIDLDKGELNKSSVTYSPDISKEYKAFVIDDMRYFVGDNKIFRYENDTYKTVFDFGDNIKEDVYFDGLGTFYIKNDDLYIQGIDRDVLYIARYSLSDMERLGEIKVGEMSADGSVVTCFNMIADGDDVFFIKENDLYHCNIKDNIIEKLYSSNGFMRFNYYSGKLFINVFDSPERGLVCIDVNDKSSKKLYSGIVSEVYILDDASVYFVSDAGPDYPLCRYDLNSGEITTVFKR